MGSPPSPAQTAPRRRLGARSPATCGTRGSRPPLHGDSPPARGGDPRPWGCSGLRLPDLRAGLHLDGANLLQLLLSHVGEFLRQLAPPALEVLQLVDGDLGGGRDGSSRGGTHPAPLQDRTPMANACTAKPGSQLAPHRGAGGLSTTSPCWGLGAGTSLLSCSWAMLGSQAPAEVGVSAMPGWSPAPRQPHRTEGLCPQQGSGAARLRFPALGPCSQHVASSSGSHRSYRLLWPAPALGTQLIFWYFHLKPQWGHGWKPLSLGWLPQRFLRPPFELWGSAAQPGPANLRHGSGADAGPQLLTDPAQPSANPWA